MNTTTNRPAHLRRIGLAALCIVLAYIGFASAAKTAGAATPVIVNNTQWLENTSTGGQTNNGANRMWVTVLVQHDVGRKVTGLRIDDNWNGTDDSATAAIKDVSSIAEQPTYTGGYGYTRVTYFYNHPTAGLSYGNTTSQVTAPIRLRARLDDGAETATVTQNIRFFRAANQGGLFPSSNLSYAYNQAQSATSVDTGDTVNFTYNMTKTASLSSNSPAGFDYRLRRLSDGALIPNDGTTIRDCNSSNMDVTFPNRGRWVVEGKIRTTTVILGIPTNDPCSQGGGDRDNDWIRIGAVDVNSDPSESPSGELTSTRPVVDGTTNISAAGISDSADAGNGGALQDVEWDLDFNATNGLDGFEETILGTPTPAAPAFTRSIDTTGFTPGWYPIRTRISDNGALGSADNIRVRKTFTDQFLVDSFPEATPQDSTLESDQTIPITLAGTDVDVYPSEGINDQANLVFTIVDQPDDGTVTAPGGGDTVTYDPDDTFSGIDTFTFQVDDGFGGTDIATVTVEVDPATDYVSVPDISNDIDARGVAPEFSSPTEGFTLTKFECSLDFTAWYDCVSGDGINDLDDGNHNLRVRANGGDNTIDPTPAETEWVIDATPTVAFTSTPTPDSGDESPTFEFDVSLPGNTAPINTECKVEGPDQSAEFQPCTSPFGLTDLNDGVYKLTVKVTDQYGKTSSTSYEWEVAVGGVHTWITEKPADFTNDADVDFAFESEPDNTFECNLDDGGWAPCSSPVELLNVGDGEHTFRVRAVSPTLPTVVDATPASWQFTVDTTPPTTTVNGNVPARTNLPLALTFASSEASSTFQCSIDGAPPVPCDTPYTSPALADGSHTLEVAAIDRAGNVDPAPVSRTWIVDTAPPTTVISDGPAAGSLLKSSAAEFEFAASESSALQCKMDDQSWRDCDSSTGQEYQGLSDGPHTFRVRATDDAGNVEASPPSRSWAIDATSPVVGIDDGPAGTVKTSGASFKFSANEDDVTFECRTDGGTWSACTSPSAVSGFADGSHTFQVRATDPAGNTSEHAASRTWTVDSSAVKPPDVSKPPVEVAPCSFKSADVRCSSPILSVKMKRVGKAKAKKASVKATIDTGLTEISSAGLQLNRKARLSLSRKARGKHFANVVITRTDGSKTTTKLTVPKKTKPGARGVVKLAGPNDFSASVKRGKRAKLSFAGLPEKVVGISLNIKGKGLSIKSKKCATQKVVSALTDREGNTATASVFVDPPCPKTKSKGAR